MSGLMHFGMVGCLVTALITVVVAIAVAEDNGPSPSESDGRWILYSYVEGSVGHCVL